MDALQQFHYGKLVHHGEPTGEMRVLAKSPGIDDDLIQLAIDHAMIEPLPGSSGVAWGLIRTRRGMPLVIPRAETGAAGQVTYQFVIVPMEVMRELAGNVKLLQGFVRDPLPVYEMLGDVLPTFKMPDNPAPSTEDQVDSLLDLLTYAKNNTRNIQPLISAVVSGVPLVVRNAPPDGEERAGFVQGLLALLPSSTRFGVTYLFHNTPATKLQAQIMFMEDSTLANSTIFDWEDGTVSGEDLQNNYSKFITSQMRLDAELVTRETEKLTPTAGWRFNNGDSLSAALDYASRRAKLDTSIENNMPVDVESVAQVLSEDPTLTGALRMAYARHLMNFSIAMDDLSHLGAITPALKDNAELEQEVFQFMVKALKDGKGSLIFETLVKLLGTPDGLHSPHWIKLMHQSALAELQELVEDEDAEFVTEYLDDIKTLGKLAVPIMERVIDLSLAVADMHPDIPSKLLMLAILYLSDEQLKRLLGSARFVKPLPREVKRMLAAVTRSDQAAPKGTLIEAIAAIDENVRGDALIAFAGMAVANRKIDLIDETALAELVRIFTSGKVPVDARLVGTIGREIMSKTISNLTRPAPRHVLQLLLLSEQYAWLARTMIIQSRDIYGPDGQFEYVNSIQDAFAQTPLKPEKAQAAIQGLEESKIRDVPLLAAITGALEGTEWHPDMSKHADRVMQQLNESPRLVEVIPPQAVMNMLQFQSRHFNERKLRAAARLAGSANAYEKGKVGLSATNQAFKLLEDDEKTKPLALEVVRQYVREAPEKPAEHMISFYGERYGQDVANRLKLAHEFSTVLGRMDWLTYTDAMQVTMEMLQNIANCYQPGAAAPSLEQMRRMADTVRRATTIGQHREIHTELKKLAFSLAKLAQNHDKQSSSNDKQIEAVVTGSQDPRSVLDVLRAAGGYMLDKKPYPLRFQQGDPTKPFGTTDGEDFVINVGIASSVLLRAATMEIKNKSLWTNANLVDELESQVKGQLTVSRDDMRQIGRNWQRLADLIYWIISSGDSRILDEKHSKGRKLDRNEQAPENALEMFRFIYGYFESGQ